MLCSSLLWHAVSFAVPSFSLSAPRSQTRRKPRYDDPPRYVLCQNALAPPSVHAFGANLSVFAASVAWTPVHAAQSETLMRAALLLDRPSAWVAHLPRTDGDHPAAPFDNMIGSVDYNDFTKYGISSSDFSSELIRSQRLGRYAKCFGDRFPLEETIVLCRVGGAGGYNRVLANFTWGSGQLLHFGNGELSHDFAQCPIGEASFRWRRRPGPPRRIHLELGICMSSSMETCDESAIARIPLELCRVDRPLYKMSFCSMPLYGFPSMQSEVPWAVDDWLSYHLDIVGFAHAEIYDVDGSFARAVEPWLHSVHDGRITYHKEWPATLSITMDALSSKYPSCSETWAYAHCLTTHRALSRWVMLLHSPDEYVVTPSHPYPGSLTDVIQLIEETLPPDEIMPFFGVGTPMFARGGSGLQEARGVRGSVLSSSRLRSASNPIHSPLLDPNACVCAGPHMCYSAWGQIGSWLFQTVEPSLLIVHHYVEWLARDHHRCLRSGQICNVSDMSMKWVEQMLRSM